MGKDERPTPAYTDELACPSGLCLANLTDQLPGSGCFALGLAQTFRSQPLRENPQRTTGEKQRILWDCDRPNQRSDQRSRARYGH